MHHTTNAIDTLFPSEGAELHPLVYIISDIEQAPPDSLYAEDIDTGSTRAYR
jgi:hypothetical protein